LDRPGSREVPFERTKEAVERANADIKVREQLFREAQTILGPNNAAREAIKKDDPRFGRLHLRQLLPSVDDQANDPGRQIPDNWEAGDDDLLDYLDKPRLVPEIGFLDLAGYSAGDDWSFVNTLLGKLAQRKYIVRNERSFLFLTW
jgi:hypothetical protein